MVQPYLVQDVVYVTLAAAGNELAVLIELLETLVAWWSEITPLVGGRVRSIVTHLELAAGGNEVSVLHWFATWHLDVLLCEPNRVPLWRRVKLHCTVLVPFTCKPRAHVSRMAPPHAALLQCSRHTQGLAISQHVHHLAHASIRFHLEPHPVKTRHD